jgi:molecular chaperone GrpE
MTESEHSAEAQNPAPGAGSELERGQGGQTVEDAGADQESLKELKQKAAERDRYREELLRAKADFDNYRKRERRDRPAVQDRAVRRFLVDLLPVVDNFERALESALAASEESPEAVGVTEGVRMIHQMLAKTLEDHGVEEVEAVGKQFDPQLHEAVRQVEVADRESGEIVDVEQKGYLHKGVLVRPSRVVVARKVDGDEAISAPGEADGHEDDDRQEGT